MAKQLKPCYSFFILTFYLFLRTYQLYNEFRKCSSDPDSKEFVEKIGTSTNSIICSFPSFKQSNATQLSWETNQTSNCPYCHSWIIHFWKKEVTTTPITSGVLSAYEISLTFTTTWNLLFLSPSHSGWSVHLPYDLHSKETTPHLNWWLSVPSPSPAPQNIKFPLLSCQNKKNSRVTSRLRYLCWAVVCSSSSFVYYSRTVINCEQHYIYNFWSFWRNGKSNANITSEGKQYDMNKLN